ncbi:Hypp5494 [Branchiostoma lanceolatum]|uniref:Hypp5494 protein n=1 Tax=Branchiostoma lanceolatum TaxID=7740 RepID=A0A8J9WF42_BRALA|nr:Hypp5494 [Branchiostoma lanceolatum]
MALRFEFLLAGILTVWMLQTVAAGETGTPHEKVGTLLQKVRKMVENDECNETAVIGTESSGSRRNSTCADKGTPLPSSENLSGDSEQTHSQRKATTANPFASNDDSYGLHMPTPISKKTALFLLILSATAPIVGLGFILSPCFDSNPRHHNGSRPRRLSSADDPDSTSAHIHIELAMTGPQDNGREDRKVEKQASPEKVSYSSEETCMTPIADNAAAMGETTVTL